MSLILPRFPATGSPHVRLAHTSESAIPLGRSPPRWRGGATFAIISHPDAGKTTLTEKLLLFGGAINLAGQVKAKASGATRAPTG